MRHLTRKHLMRSLIIAGLLVATALVLTACSVDYYRVGEVTGRVTRDIVERLKVFWEGFVAGFGGQFCAAPVSGIVILAFGLKHRRKA